MESNTPLLQSQEYGTDSNTPLLQSQEYGTDSNTPLLQSQEVVEGQSDEPTESLSKRKEVFLFTVILGSQFVSSTIDTFLFPFFSKEATRKGLNQSEVGLVFSSFEVSRFLCSLLVGKLIASLPLRTWCLIGSAVTAISCVSFGLASYGPNAMFLPMCMTLRMTAGAGSSALTVAGTTMLLKVSSFKVGTVTGLAEMIIGASYASGPMIGSAIYMLGGYTTVFWVMGGVTATLTFLLSLLQVKVAAETNSTKERHSLALLKTKSIPFLYLLTFVHRFVSFARTSMLGAFLISTFDQADWVIGLSYSVWAVMYMVACLITAKFVNKNFVYSCMLVAWLFNSFCYLFLAPSPVLDFIFHGHKYFPMTFAALLLVNVVDTGQLIPLFQAVLNILIVNGYPSDNASTYGIATALISSSLSLGGVMGPTVSGAMVDLFGFPWTTTITSVLSLAGFLMLSSFLVIMKSTNTPLSTEDDCVKGASYTPPPSLSSRLSLYFRRSTNSYFKVSNVQPSQSPG